MPSKVEIGPVVLEKKMNMWKVYDNNDDSDVDDGQRTNFAFGSGQLKSFCPNFRCLYYVHFLQQQNVSAKLSRDFSFVMFFSSDSISFLSNDRPTTFRPQMNIYLSKANE